MLEWQIGKVTVSRIEETEMAAVAGSKHAFLPQATPENLREMPWLYPHFVGEDGTMKLSVHALLVRAPGINMVVDTCFGNDKPRALLGRKPLQTAFLDTLASTGCAAEAVDTVVCTHLHVDHVGWNTRLEGDRWVPTFPNARYLMGRQEYEHWSNEDDPENQAILSDSVQPIFDHGLATLVEMDHRISPELRLIPTPGHTPGHVSVMIESEGERALITGDVLHHPCQFGRPEWSPVFDSDPDAGARTRRSVMDDVADAPVLVIGTHFAAPTAGHVLRDGNAFRFNVD